MCVLIIAVGRETAVAVVALCLVVHHPQTYAVATGTKTWA